MKCGQQPVVLMDDAAVEIQLGDNLKLSQFVSPAFGCGVDPGETAQQTGGVCGLSLS